MINPQMPLPVETFCSFCAATCEERKFLLMGQGASICDGCIEMSLIIILRGATLETIQGGFAQLRKLKNND